MKIEREGNRTHMYTGTRLNPTSSENECALTVSGPDARVGLEGVGQCVILGLRGKCCERNSQREYGRGDGGV